jgi:hypothetical protein
MSDVITLIFAESVKVCFSRPDTLSLCNRLAVCLDRPVCGIYSTGLFFINYL